MCLNKIRNIKQISSYVKYIFLKEKENNIYIYIYIFTFKFRLKTKVPISFI